MSQARQPGLDVTTFGEVLGLMLAVDGPLDEAHCFRRSLAGAEFNVAVGLARLGHSVEWAGRVGEDTFGAAAIRRLRAEGISARVQVDPDLPTGVLFRDQGASRPITVWYSRSGSAGSALSAADLCDRSLGSARLLHVSGITPLLSASAAGATTHAIREAKRHGVHVSFDPNVRLKLAPASRWEEVAYETAILADTVLMGRDEAGTLGRAGDPAWLLDHGVATVVLKDGAHGAAEHSRLGTLRADALPVAVLDPVGAGDAFAAGWISGWLDELPPEDRLERAVAVGALAVAASGDIEGLPSRTTLGAMLGRIDAVR